MKRKNNSLSAHAALGVLFLTATLIFAYVALAETRTTVDHVNINTADIEQLTALPGIGQSKAQAIIDYRSEHGPYPNVDTLADVQGIGIKMLEKIRPFITTKQQ
jgi:competence protein ComEA